ncbi:hypothetical protein V2W45_145516 [Cenococcum geophilum]
MREIRSAHETYTVQDDALATPGPLPRLTKSTRAAITTQKKACSECTTAKARYDLCQSSCTRCTTRSLRYFVTLMSPLQDAMSDSSPQESDLNFGQAQRLDFSGISLVPFVSPIGLENVFNFANGDVSYLAEELAMLLAPCGKRLWEARNREAWMKEYDVYLQLQMHEFWPKVEGEEERKQRVHEWAEEVDEFGMMMLAACTILAWITHGS